jgi:hypothetical protein
VHDRRLALVALVLLAAVVGLVPDLQDSILVGQRRLSASVSEPLEITNDPQLMNDTVIRDEAMTWGEICTAAYKRFCPPPSQRQGE